MYGYSILVLVTPSLIHSAPPCPTGFNSDPQLSGSNSNQLIMFASRHAARALRATTNMQQVPTTRDVVPGALVNIVLKVDQPTGRTVSGVVSQLLTRGNHPRGIKVRLEDGRVGRVQSMVGTATAATFRAQTVDDTEVSDEGPPARTAHGGPRQYHPRRGQEQPSAAQQIGLDAYIKPAKKKRGHDKARDTGSNATVTATGSVSGHQDESASLCPMCDFRGDAAALNYHVQSHFDD
ncbi:hypothetical protein VTK56DRAFT_3070 [Thermocarpiscus australiensis]